ncbi:50S ribosomal protein L1 [Blattabacterium cuenoti]|uniref:50S ribosomal protein L1 n=1 Tax=Blattabacterium cuenoti TaxID=1653831 RepID=UPI00163CD60D|nr:50S ribosomal protein L1 [Blattabacterium cuenoti]
MTKKLTKNRKNIIKKISKKKYPLEESLNLLKELSFVKFDESVDISVRLGIDVRLSNQIIKGSLILPHGSGKKKCILALVTKEKEKDVKKYGADYVGLDYIEKIKNGWTNIDVVISMPNVMNQIRSISKILGPKGLMPSLNMGTVSVNPEKLVKEIKCGRIFFKSDRYGIIHSSVGKISFSCKHLLENVKEFMKKLIHSKPPSSKGDYIKSIFLSTTMSNSISVDHQIFVKK